MMESEDDVAYRRDSSLESHTMRRLMVHRRLTLRSRIKKLKFVMLDPPTLSGFRRDSKTMSWTSQNVKILSV